MQNKKNINCVKLLEEYDYNVLLSLVMNGMAWQIICSKSNKNSSTFQYLYRTVQNNETNNTK